MLKTTSAFDFKRLWRGERKKNMSGPHPPNAHLWGISTELQRVPRGGELNQQLSPPAPPRPGAIHERTHVRPHTENLAVGLSPPWHGWTFHSAPQGAAEYPGGSRQLQNVNPQPALPPHC